MQWRKKQQRAYDPEKGLYKQADLDKQFETYVKETLGARGFTDEGTLTWPVSYEKLRKTRFNEDWRFKTYNEGMDLKRLIRQTDSVGRQARIDARYHEKLRRQKEILDNK